ncbi:MAG: FeoB-associated Cys-rich membrane protein [Eubacterium sp.]|nr:FeoB-associated Cys-rich membrane protein [Eubacterium sp.]
MLAFLTANLSTIIIAVIVIGILAAIIVKMIKDKKKGKSSCGCGCSNCAASDLCHKKGTPTNKM